MSSNIVNRTEEFFNRLGEALGRPSPQNREVISEVRADFPAQVEALQKSGMDEGEAVDEVLAQMGEPEVMAAGMKQVLPPLSSGPVAVIRYVLAGGAILWTLVLMWTFRAWDYGLSPGLFFALLFHLPLIVVLWPKIIWRKNWLFGVVPAAVLVLGAIALNVAGVEHTSTELLIVEDGVLAVPPEVELAEEADGVRWQLLVLLGVLLVAVTVMFGMIQQRRQRLVLLGAVLVAVLAMEGAFQWEERLFRQQRDHLARVVKAAARPLPERGTLQEAGVTGANRGRYALQNDGPGFTMWWPRPLSPGFSICYGSEDDRIWIND